MVKWERWKVIFFAVVCFLVSIRIYFIVGRGEIDKQYLLENHIDISTVKEELTCKDIAQDFTFSNSNLNKIELIFNNIADNEQGFVILKISIKGGNLIYQTNLSLSAFDNMVWKQIFVNVPIDPNKIYTLELNVSENCTQIPHVLVVDDKNDLAISGYQYGSLIGGQIAVQFGYLQQPSLFNKVVSASLWMLLIVIIYLIISNLHILSCQVNYLLSCIYNALPYQVFGAVAESLLCIIMLECSGITFQWSTRVIFLIISLISIVNGRKRYYIVSEIFVGTCKKTILYLMYGYAAFALVGQRIFVYPLSMKVTVVSLFVFVITYLWVIPVVNAYVYFLCVIGKKIIKKQGKKIHACSLVLILVVLLLMPAAYNLVANNPGISTPDTLATVVNAFNLHGMYDWHPFFYSLLLRMILAIWNSTYAVIMVQYFFWTYVMLEFLMYLRKKGIRDEVLFFISFVSGINAANFLHLNTIWKDIPYSLSLLWSIVILTKLSVDYNEYKRKGWIYFELVISLVGICLYRKNGVVAFFIIILMLFILLRHNKKVWVSLAASLAIICLIKGPVYDYFDVITTGRYGIYIGLSQDILGVYYSGGEVSENTIQMINVMTDYNNAEYKYIPTWSYSSYELNVEPAEFIKNYLDTFIKNPIPMARSIIAREDAIWDIFPGEGSTLGCVNTNTTMDGKSLSGYCWNDFYPVRKYSSIYNQMLNGTTYTTSRQWISAIEWRGGVLTLLGAVSFITLINKKGWKRYLLIPAPIIGQWLSLLLSTGWAEFRYYWSLNLMNVCLVMFVIILLSNEENLVNK